MPQKRSLSQDLLIPVTNEASIIGVIAYNLPIIVQRLVMSIMCPACQAIMPGVPGTEPHGELGHQGFIYSTQRGREGSREDRFRCLACEAKWLRETDKWGTDLGFKLAP